MFPFFLTTNMLYEVWRFTGRLGDINATCGGDQGVRVCSLNEIPLAILLTLCLSSLPSLTPALEKEGGIWINVPKE